MVVVMVVVVGDSDGEMVAVVFDVRFGVGFGVHCRCVYRRCGG